MPERAEKLILNFPVELVHEPNTYRLIKDFDVIVNIIWARINPNEEGELIVEIVGESENVENAVSYLKGKGVGVSKFSDHFKRDEDVCYDCGLCVGVCPFGALTMNRETWEVEYDVSKCLACGSCVSVCPPRAIKFDLSKALNGGDREGGK